MRLSAQATEPLGVGVTGALTDGHPCPFARRMGTLDHRTRGRVGWNIVTGYRESAARNMGLPRMAHGDRYDLAMSTSRSSMAVGTRLGRRSGAA